MKEDKQQQGVGRTSNTGVQEQASFRPQRDISNIDQQEGEMNNGTIGRDWEHEQTQNKKEDEQGKTI